MAALIERMDPNNEQKIAGEYICEAFRLMYAGHLTASDAKARIGSSAGASMTQDEADEFDALYALRPDPLDLSALTVLLAPVATALEPVVDAPFYQWCDEISAIFHAYQYPWDGFDEPANIRPMLGLPNP